MPFFIDIFLKRQIARLLTHFLSGDHPLGSCRERQQQSSQNVRPVCVDPYFYRVQEGELALAAVGRGDDLVPVDHGAAADVGPEAFEGNLPRKLICKEFLNIVPDPVLSYAWEPPLLR